jgi:hypothetical protein
MRHTGDAPFAQGTADALPPALPAITQGGTPHELTSHAARRIAAAAILLPACALAAAPAAPGTPAHPAAAVPVGFQPAAASSRSPASGIVLGRVACKELVNGVGSPCAARLVATTDGGAHWRFLTAPAVLFFNAAGDIHTQASRVSSVVFAGRRDGWLYGTALWSTRDGGARWCRLSLGGTIEAMAASAGTAYAVVAPRGRA